MTVLKGVPSSAFPLAPTLARRSIQEMSDSVPRTIFPIW